MQVIISENRQQEVELESDGFVPNEIFAVKFKEADWKDEVYILSQKNCSNILTGLFACIGLVHIQNADEIEIYCAYDKFIKVEEPHNLSRT